MPLLNYTTRVTVPRTVDAITELLRKAGATSIATEYVGGTPTAVAFRIDTPEGLRTFQLPVNTAPVLGVLKAQGVEGRYCNPDQAERVAWRILKDWLEAQLAIIETEMVTLEQVMLPYLYDGELTVYQHYLAANRTMPELTP